jgi:hypothetical protein
MGLTTKTLGELLEYMDTERLQLPEIQREFIWRRQSIKLLFDSLFRELPIGQMLVWKPRETTPKSRGFYKKPHRRNPAKIDQFYGYLLDGQQRLTAISRIREADDDYPLMIDLHPEREEGDDETFFWGGRYTDTNPWFLRVSDVLASDFNVVKHIEALRKDEEFKDRHAEPVRKMLAKLQGILNYDISVIEFESDSHKEATELFVRFNSTGRKLNKNDLVLAELATRIEGLTSTKMGKLLDQWKPNFQFTRPFLIQCLVAVHTGRMNLRKPEETWADSTPKEIEASWGKTARALDMVIEFLTGTVLWESASWIPSFNALIPLVYAVANAKSFSSQERKLARKWLLLTGVHGYFSASVYTELDQLLRKMQKEPSIEQLWNVTRKRLPKLRPDDLNVMRRSSPLMSIFISMLRAEGARDWINDNPLNGTVLGKNAKLHVHHFFPRALLAKNDYVSDWINTFANYTVLCASTNFDVSTEEPATYLQRIQAEPKQLQAQCIPQDPELWKVSNYEEFISKREQLLIRKFNEFLEFE